MVHEKWLISDTHFYHENTWAKFKQADGSPLRPFNSTDVMNMTMWNNWNRVVKPTDFVYHLGDVTFNYNKEFIELFRGLNGQKRLIVGNHDNIIKLVELKLFDKIELWKGHHDKLRPYANFTMSHIPLLEGQGRWGVFNVHGHVHAESKNDPHYINMCVEVRNYAPTHFDTIFEEIKQRQS